MTAFDAAGNASEPLLVTVSDAGPTGCSHLPGAAWGLWALALAGIRRRR